MYPPDAGGQLAYSRQPDPRLDAAGTPLLQRDNGDNENTSDSSPASDGEPEKKSAEGSPDPDGK